MAAAFGRPAATAAAIFANSASVDSSNANRFRAFGRKGRVAPGDQPLAGVVRVGDLGQLRFIEQGHLQRAVVGGSAAIAGARSAVTQRIPGSARSAVRRALLIIPRSPTITSSSWPSSKP